MPTYTSYDTVGAKESVADVISNLSPSQTPFQSMIRDQKIKNRVHEWQEDSLAAVRDNAEVEGADATDATLTPTVMRQNNTQILQKTAKVSDTAEEIDNYGRDKEMAYQLRKVSKELKRDLENTLVGTAQAANLGSNTVARRMAGVQALIDPAGKIAATASGTAALTEALHMQGNQRLYDNGSDASIFMVKPADAVRIAAFAAATGRSRDVGDGKKIVNVVNILETPFGTQRVVMNRWLKADNALLTDPDNWRRLVLRNWFRRTLAKTGDATRVQIIGEFSLKHSNFLASVLLTNLA